MQELGLLAREDALGLPLPGRTPQTEPSDGTAAGPEGVRHGWSTLLSGRMISRSVTRHGIARVQPVGMPA